MKEKIREYLTFTRRERLGVAVLLIIILALFIVPYWIRRPPGTEDPEATREFGPLIENSGRDSLRSHAYAEKTSVHRKYLGDDGDEAGHAGEKDRPAVPAALFYFDPNRTSERDWQRLGLSERQTRTLVHYTAKGGRFRSADDLGKIYGLSTTDRERLAPYVRIAGTVDRSERPPVWQRNAVAKPWYKPDSGTRYAQRYPKKLPVRIDINQADSLAWEQLPGIGEKLAGRIIRFREKLGGFYSIDQVGETFGLPDSSFQKIRPWLRADSARVQQIDLNAASGEVLRQHPYIRWKLASILLKYREQHGRFDSVGELEQLALPDAGALNRLRPYLTATR